MQRGQGEADLTSSHPFDTGQYVLTFGAFLIPVAAIFFAGFESGRSTGKFAGIMGAGEFADEPAGAWMHEDSQTVHPPAATRHRRRRGIHQPSVRDKAMRTAYQIVSDHYAASARHDLDGMLADLAADAQWVEMETSAYAGTHVGREQIVAKVFAPIGADWEGFAFTLERLIDGGDTVVALGYYSGTFKATGKPMRARVAHVWEVEGGRIRRFEQFADTLALERATR